MTLAGLFIEPRQIKQIYYNISNFFEIFKNSKLYFYCGNKLYKKYKFLEEKYKHLTIRELEVSNLNSLTYSDFLKNVNLWDSIEADYCLTIQTDGCLCNKSEYNIKDFLKYDFVGGGRYHILNNIYYKYDTLNGGFSLRNVKVMKDILNKIPPLKTKKISFFDKIFKNKIQNIKCSAEDSYFYNSCKILNYKVGDDLNSINFSLHEINNYKYNNFCIHKLNPKYFSFNDIKKILDYCPNYKFFINTNYENNSIEICEIKSKNNVKKLIFKKVFYMLRFYLLILSFLILFTYFYFYN